MIIDAFTHIYPRRYVDFIERSQLALPAFFQRAPAFMAAAARVAEMDRHGIDMQVLALGTPAFDELFGSDHPQQALEAARIANDEIAAVVAARPHRFVGVATLPLVSVAAVELALGELERAVRQLELRGVQLYTAVGGEPLDRPALFPLYEMLVAHDLPILLHPTAGDYNERTRDYLLWLTFGWPFETTLAMSRLVYSGVLEQFPQLKILTHHLGAYVPHMAARITGVSATLRQTTDWSLPQPVLTYFKRFYGDTAVNGHQPALESGYRFFGTDHILFATDFPFVPVGETLRAILDWELPAREKAQILGENARRLFGL